MKFLDLDRREHGIDTSRYKRKGSSKSEGQGKLGDELEEMFEHFEVLEEFPCVGTRLKLDFFIPGLKFAFEYDGVQHGKYVPRFHKNRQGFARSQERDSEKEEWCEINGIRLIRVPDGELDQLRELIFGEDS